MTTSAIEITSIIRSAGTQFRANMNDDNVEDMMDLIERGITFKTKIRLAELDGRLYLTDGFHRIEAYRRLDILEIPSDQCVIVPASSIEEVRVMAMGANVQHGKGTTEADYFIIIKKMMELEGGKYMKNAFEPDIKLIAESIGAAVTAVRRGYSDYKGAKDNPHPSLSQQCKERRDAAILESHKEGMSDNAIAKLFKMTQSTVTRIRGELMQNAESAKCITPETSTSTVPMASTEDRFGTRASSSFVNEQLEELLGPDYLDMDGNAAFSLSEDEADAPAARFDVLAATGYGEYLCQYTKPSQPANEFEQVEYDKANPVKLQEEWMVSCDKIAELKAMLEEELKHNAWLKRRGVLSGVALPE
jgi:DNA-binding NarL/FixJ family response regulator